MLRSGDQLPLSNSCRSAGHGISVPESWRPHISHGGSTWQVGVLPGPNADPDYFTPEDITTFYGEPYKVHYNS